MKREKEIHSKTALPPAVNACTLLQTLLPSLIIIKFYIILTFLLSLNKQKAHIFKMNFR